jgi:hypothetical protein
MKKKVIYFFIFLLLFSFAGYTQDTINWQPSYKLKWKDFQASPNTSSPFAALSACSISYGFSYKNNVLDYSVYAFFTRSLSWSKFKNDSALLTHEQGHFNISELFARKLRKAITEYTVNTSSINKDFETMFNKIWDEKKAYDSLYDKETNHARIIKKQMEWNIKIASELNNLNNYKQQ